MRRPVRPVTGPMSKKMNGHDADGRTDDSINNRSERATALRGDLVCEITLCAQAAQRETVDHPQRGEMVVCATHARNIRALSRRPSVETEAGV